MRNKIIEEARTYNGVKWVHQGRTDHGLDCCGLIIRVANDLKLTDFDITAYPRQATDEQFASHFFTAGMIEIPKTDIRHGDVVLTHTMNHPCHCGFIAERNGHKYFIHAFKKRGAVVEDMYDRSVWERKTYRALRFRQVMEA